MVNEFIIKKSNKKDHAVDIHFKDQVICLIEWNKKTVELDVVFYPYESMKGKTIFLIQGFLDALKEAKAIVLQSVSRD